MVPQEYTPRGGEMGQREGDGLPLQKSKAIVHVRSSDSSMIKPYLAAVLHSLASFIP